VVLTTDAPLVVPPATISIPAGASSNTFSLHTNAVSATAQVTLTATYRGDSKSATLTVRPIGVESLVLNPTSVVGGSAVTGTVRLECLAGPTDITVTLSSSNPGAAAPAVGTVIIRVGTVSGTFMVNTSVVAATTPLPLGATANGTGMGTTLTVTPAPSNLLVNGSFEMPAVLPSTPGYLTFGPSPLPGWRVTRGTVDIVHARYWQPAPGQGSQSLDLVGSPGAGTIEQTFPTEPGQEYVFSGWLSHSYYIDERRADVFLNDQFFTQLATNTPSTAADMQWRRFEYRFRASSPTTTLKIVDVSNESDLDGTALDGLDVRLAPGG
jgi:hypothetical protein